MPPPPSLSPRPCSPPHRRAVSAAALTLALLCCLLAAPRAGAQYIGWHRYPLPVTADAAFAALDLSSVANFTSVPYTTSRTYAFPFSLFGMSTSTVGVNLNTSQTLSLYSLAASSAELPGSIKGSITPFALEKYEFNVNALSFSRRVHCDAAAGIFALRTRGPLRATDSTTPTNASALSKAIWALDVVLQSPDSIWASLTLANA